MKFAVYSLFNLNHDTSINKISGDFKTVEEAITFKSLLDEIDIDVVLESHEIFVSTVLEHVDGKIPLKKENVYSTEEENGIYQKYLRIMRNYNMYDLLG